MNIIKMHNPAHPGEILREWIPEEMAIAAVSQALQIPRARLSKLLNGNARINAELALRLSAWLGTSPEVWLKMQTQWDLWQAKQKPRPRVERLSFDDA